MIVSCSPSCKAKGQTQDHPSLERKKKPFWLNTLVQTKWTKQLICFLLSCHKYVLSACFQPSSTWWCNRGCFIPGLLLVCKTPCCKHESWTVFYCCRLIWIHVWTGSVHKAFSRGYSQTAPVISEEPVQNKRQMCFCQIFPLTFTSSCCRPYETNLKK